MNIVRNFYFVIKQSLNYVRKDIPLLKKKLKTEEL